MNVKSTVRFEKILIFVFIIGLGLLFFVGIQDKMKGMDGESSNSNKTVKKENIGEFNTMKLYITDYIYNTSINGYTYTEVTLNNDIIENVKKEISELDINNSSDEVVYGQYKLVLDDKTIYYDIDNESAMINGKIFKFPKNIKTKINITNNTCSCCTSSNCNINLCKCNG